jgi:hypothetical protein
MRIRNSVRAALIALAPLAIFHAAMSANRIAGNVSSGAPMPLPDIALGIVALRVAIDALLIGAGHLLLRYFGVGSRSAYGTMGAVATALGYVIAWAAEIRTINPITGAFVTAAILPAMVGMIAGFLYAQLAGRDANAVPAADGDMPALPATYDGPLQVRSSFAAGTIASLVPALIVTVLAVPLLMMLFFESPSFHALFLAAPAQMFVTALLVTIAPSALVVGATHALARSLRRTRGLDYAAIAAVLNCIPACMLLAMVGAALLFPLAAITGAVMGATYRRFAGIEPLPLPEDVLATDPRALVPEDHPSRRTHAVVMNG